MIAFIAGLELNFRRDPSSSASDAAARRRDRRAVLYADPSPAAGLAWPWLPASLPGIRRPADGGADRAADHRSSRASRRRSRSRSSPTPRREGPLTELDAGRRRDRRRSTLIRPLLAGDAARRVMRLRGVGGRAAWIRPPGLAKSSASLAFGAGGRVCCRVRTCESARAPFPVVCHRGCCAMLAAGRDVRLRTVARRPAAGLVVRERRAVEWRRICGTRCKHGAHAGHSSPSSPRAGASLSLGCTRL